MKSRRNVRKILGRGFVLSAFLTIFTAFIMSLYSRPLQVPIEVGYYLAASNTFMVLGLGLLGYFEKKGGVKT